MKKITLVFGSLVCASFLVGCANTEKIQGSSAVPAAQGKITADRAKGGATDLKIEVEHLAEPQKLGANHYVVWIQPEDSQQFQNIGTLQVDGDLEGELETTIPYEEFRVMVTPERDIAALHPSGPVIFDQEMER